MTQQISMPFQVGPNGGIFVETSPDRQVTQNVRALVGTQPGERVMLPAYGVDTLQTLFEPEDELMENELAASIRQALATWEPTMSAVLVNPVLNREGDGLSHVEVLINRQEQSLDAPTNNLVNRATVRVGGRVLEVVGG